MAGDDSARVITSSSLRAERKYQSYPKVDTISDATLSCVEGLERCDVDNKFPISATLSPILYGRSHADLHPWLRRSGGSDDRVFRA